MHMKNFERAKQIQQSLATIERNVKDLASENNDYKLSEEIFHRQKAEKVSDLTRQAQALKAEFDAL